MQHAVSDLIRKHLKLRVEWWYEEGEFFLREHQKEFVFQSLEKIWSFCGKVRYLKLKVRYSGGVYTGMLCGVIQSRAVRMLRINSRKEGSDIMSVLIGALGSFIGKMENSKHMETERILNMNDDEIEEVEDFMIIPENMHDVDDFVFPGDD